MTFEMMRLGWPNTAAIMVLAMMPIVALTTIAPQRTETVEARLVEPAANCLSLADCPVSIAIADPQTILE